MPGLHDALRERAARYRNNPNGRAAKLLSAFDAALNLANGVAQIGDETRKDKNLSAHGQIENVRKKMPGCFAHAGQLAGIVETAKREQAAERARLALPVLSSDPAAAAMRAETRGWLRSLSVSERMKAIEIKTIDPHVAESILEAPPPPFRA